MPIGGVVGDRLGVDENRDGDRFDRVKRALEVGENSVSHEEMAVAREFWDVTLQEVNWEQAGAMAFLLAEEAVMLRVLGHRLLVCFDKGDLMVGRKTGPDVLNPAVEAWAKTQERLRKVMKELLEQYTERSGGDAVTLASMMAPVVEQGEGVLDDAVEFEARKKSVEEAGDGPEGD